MSKAPFLAFDIDLDTFLASLETRLEENRETIDALLQIKEKTYSNFVKPFEMLDERLEHFFTPLSHLNAVNNSEQTQQVYSDALPIITEYGTEIGQNLAIYKAFKAIKEHEYSRLNKEQQRVIDLNILGFELSGAALERAKKERLKAINLRKSTLSNDFSQNLLDATNDFELIIDDEKEVEGLPQSDLEAARFEEEGAVKYRFTLQMPSYIAYMTYGPSREKREILYKAYTTRAPENAAIIDELLSLKREMAQLLGFDSYAEYSLATKMAPDTSTVLHFLEELAASSRQQGAKELDALRAMTDEALESFDTAYYGERLKKE
jgi:oligopeptidase A